MTLITSIKDEIYRKIFHLLLLFVPISYYFLGKWKLLAILIPISAIIILLDFYRRKNQKIQSYFIKIFRPILLEHEIEQDKFCSASYACFALTIMFLLFKSEIAIIGAFILIICDSAAAIIGRNFPSEPFFEKTLYGSAAFFISGIIVLITCAVHYHFKASLYIFGFFSLFVSTMIEARPSLLNLDDNFTAPFSFALTLSIFDIIWNYSY
jgi:dolichol kinase